MGSMEGFSSLDDVEVLRKAFHAFDLDASGTIELSELVEVFR
jgi:Ca2+-binding EF-hand superfamily protein